MAYVHPAGSTIAKLSYAEPINCTLTIWRSQTNMDSQGGNPCLIYSPAGAWAAGDYNDIAADPPARPPAALWQLLLDPANALTSPAFTIIGCGYRVDGMQTGLKESTHGYQFEGMEDVARCVQWVKMNAHLYGINRFKIFTVGASAGSCNPMRNFLAPSLPYSAGYSMRSRWDYTVDSSVLGHVNFYGEISCEPSTTPTNPNPYNQITTGFTAPWNPANTVAGLYGTRTASGTNYNEQVQIPRSIQRNLSPARQPESSLGEDTNKNIYSLYDLSEAGAGSGHDPAQAAPLGVAIATSTNHVEILVPGPTIAVWTTFMPAVYTWLKAISDGYIAGNRNSLWPRPD